MQRIEPFTYDLPVGESGVRHKIFALTDQERHRLMTVLALLIGADEALADIRTMGLASVGIEFCQLGSSQRCLSPYTPRDLLRIVQDAQFADELESNVRLVIDY